MYFLIDYENISYPGLDGCEYLREDDSVILFYSGSACTISERVLRSLLESGCRVELCRLKQKGKNGLDFYIAVKVGEIFGRGYKGKIGIISKDTGYKAVFDYCSMNYLSNIVIGVDIVRCILESQDNSERGILCKNDTNIVNILTYYNDYNKRVNKEAISIGLDRDKFIKEEESNYTIQSKVPGYLLLSAGISKDDEIEIDNEIVEVDTHEGDVILEKKEDMVVSSADESIEYDLDVETQTQTVQETQEQEVQEGKDQEIETSGSGYSLKEILESSISLSEVVESSLELADVFTRTTSDEFDVSYSEFET